jgi:amidase
LENAIADSMTDEQFEQDLHHLRSVTRQKVDDCLAKSGADVIMASGDSLMKTVAAATGYPIGCVPLEYAAFNGRAFGMEIMARSGEEGLIFKVMSAWEATFPGFKKPQPMLVD